MHQRILVILVCLFVGLLDAQCSCNSLKGNPDKDKSGDTSKGRSDKSGGIGGGSTDTGNPDNSSNTGNSNNTGSTGNTGNSNNTGNSSNTSNPLPKDIDDTIEMAKGQNLNLLVDVLTKLKNGQPVDVNQVDLNHEFSTALHQAASREKRKAIVEFLLRNDAKAAVRSKDGITALYTAADKKYKDYFDLMLQYDSDGSAKDTLKTTLLNQAIEKDRWDIIKFLIANYLDKIDINAKDPQDPMKYTPLHRAVEKGDLELARLLVNNNAKVNNEAWFKLTPLHKAAELGDESIAKLLIDNQANKDAEDEDKQTPLYFAVWNNKPNMVKLLCKAGANLELPNKDQDTPLLRAVKNSNSMIVQVLMEYGASKLVKDKDLKTPFQLANSLPNKEKLKEALATVKKTN